MANVSGFKTLTTPRGKRLKYFLGLPKDFVASKAYRTILAIPPGAQDKSEVEPYQPWIEYFTKRNWVMVCPVTPDGKLFFQGSERYLPYLMDLIRNELKIEGNKFHLLGVSNGGISAFRVATLHPERFHSITVIPGWPKPADENRLEKIFHIPVNFIVGAEDVNWLKKSEEFAGTLRKMGADVFLDIYPGEGHTVFRAVKLDTLEKLLLRT